MKLSEAIRLGAMTNGQAFNCLIDGKGNTCAQGAALSAWGVTDEEIFGMLSVGDWERRVPELLKQLWAKVEHPITGETLSMATTIRMLNNDDRWSRTRIAEWVATVEVQPTEQLVLYETAK